MGFIIHGSNKRKVKRGNTKFNSPIFYIYALSLTVARGRLLCQVPRGTGGGGDVGGETLTDGDGYMRDCVGGARAVCAAHGSFLQFLIFEIQDLGRAHSWPCQHCQQA